jgi:hypothetical protein
VSARNRSQTASFTVSVAAEVRRPGDGLGQRVDVALVAVAATADAPQDAARETGLEVRAAGKLERSLEGNAAVGPHDAARVERGELVAEGRLEPARAGGEEAFGQARGSAGARIGYLSSRRRVSASAT